MLHVLAMCNISDINECNTGLHNCDENADCSNTDGSYTCTCKPSFYDNGRKCESIITSTQYFKFVFFSHIIFFLSVGIPPQIDASPTNPGE